MANAEIISCNNLCPNTNVNAYTVGGSIKNIQNSNCHNENLYATDLIKED